jgi:hypothetical protein
VGGTVVTRFSRFFILLVGFALLPCGFLSGRAFAALLPASSLTATATSSSSVTLRWTDTNTSEPGYVVQRSLGSAGGFKRVKILGPGAVSYSDSGLAPATTYYYRIVTRSTSRHSAVASATTFAGGSLPTPTPTPAATPGSTPTPRPTSTPVPTGTPAPTGDKIPPSVPGGLTGSAPTCTQVNLSWKPSADTGGSGLEGYRVFRNGSPSISVPNPAVSATDTAVNGGAVYTYSVAAMDNAGNESGTSNTLLLNTPPCPTGGAPWAKHLGGTGTDFAQAVAVDSSGNVIVVGSFTSTANFGGGQLVSAGGSDIFVATYSASGAHIWSKRFGGVGDDGALSVAVDSSGAIVVAGDFWGASADLGGGPLINGTPGLSEAFVAKYSASGQHLWSESFGGTDSDSANGVAVDSSGDVLVTGVFKGAGVDFAGKALSSEWGGIDTFIVKLSGANGANVWAKNVRCGGPDIGYGIAVDQSGSVFVVGAFAGSADFGAGYLLTAGNNDIYLAKYSSAGAYLWAKRFGGSGQDSGAAVAVDGNGDVAITGNFLGTVDFGGGPLTSSTSSNDIFVAKYKGTTGAHLWSKRFGDYYVDYGLGIAADAQGNVLVTGSFFGTVNFGGGPLTSASNQTGDAFVAEYSPSGAHLWSQRYGNAGTEWGQGVAFGPNGPVVTGFFSGTVDFGGVSLTSAGREDGFLLYLGQ